MGIRKGRATRDAKGEYVGGMAAQMRESSMDVICNDRSRRSIGRKNRDPKRVTEPSRRQHVMHSNTHANAPFIDCSESHMECKNENTYNDATTTEILHIISPAIHALSTSSILCFFACPSTPCPTPATPDTALCPLGDSSSFLFAPVPETTGWAGIGAGGLGGTAATEVGGRGIGVVPGVETVADGADAPLDTIGAVLPTGAAEDPALGSVLVPTPGLGVCLSGRPGARFGEGVPVPVPVPIPVFPSDTPDLGKAAGGRAGLGVEPVFIPFPTLAGPDPVAVPAAR